MKSRDTIAPAIRRLHPELNDQQLNLIGHRYGPLLGIAGPGAGKTLAIVLRTLNLLLLGLVDPGELLVCTYNRAAAREMRTRFYAAATAAGYKGDLSRVRITTIHGLCGNLLRRHGRLAGFPRNLRLLNDEEQQELLAYNVREVFGNDLRILERRGWRRRPSLIRHALKFFDRICDELIDPQELIDAGGSFKPALGRSYRRYQALLLDRGAADFAHLQRWAVELLEESDEASHKISTRIRQLMCDEYQDTSYAQEQLLLQLARVHGNICVVGDEDQALYRFRGARVANILRFPDRFDECRVLELTVNYRSHPSIVRAYDRWMASADWSNPDSKGAPFRYDKTITPHRSVEHADYPAVIAIEGAGPGDEGRQLLQLLQFLKRRSVIKDFSQTALLLHSMREAVAGPYLDALEDGGIPASFYVAGGKGRDSIRRPDPAVSITTIHQSKGLEWDVVIVGSLDFRNRHVDPVGRVLLPHAESAAFEPSNRIALYDHMRQHYVAFSRARRLLVLTANHEPKARFDPIWDPAVRWHEMDRNERRALGRQRFCSNDAASQLELIDRASTSRQRTFESTAHQRALDPNARRIRVRMGAPADPTASVRRA